MAIDRKGNGVEIRETRLGSVTGYAGTAGDLCGRKRRGTLADRGRSFSQCSSCASVTAVCQLSMIRDAAVVNHAPLGCAGDFSSFDFCYRTGSHGRGLPLQNVRLVSSDLREKDIVYGGEDRLLAAVREANARFRPKAIFITASCASGIIGDDLPAVARRAETEAGVPVVPVFCEGFRSRVWATGFDAAFHAILSRIVKPARTRNRNLVNVINFWGKDVFTELFGEIGLVPNFVVPFSTVGQLEALSETAATVQMCPTLGTYLAAGLEEHFGVPEVKAPPPYGIAGTDAWLEALGRTVGREREVEKLIRAEKERIAPELSELKEKLSGITAYVAAGDAHGHAVLCVLRELGIRVVGACTWHHDAGLDHGDPAADSLRHVLETYGDVPFSVCNKQAFEQVNLLSRLRPDIYVVRHHGMSVWGAKLGIPTLLMGDEHFGLGYRGILRYGRKILDAVANPAFVRSLARHTRLPYTEWWLRRDPHFFLEEGA